MTNKKEMKKANKAKLFSLTSLLQNKAVKRVEKLQSREARRQGLILEKEVALHEHVHGENCNHAPVQEEDLSIDVEIEE